MSLLSVGVVPGPPVCCAVRALVLGGVVNGVAKCHLEHNKVDFLVVLFIWLGVLEYQDLIIFLLVGGMGRPSFVLWAS